MVSLPERKRKPSIKMLSMALFAENRNSAEVCGNFDALSKMFPELALGEPIPDAMIEALEARLKFYQERLAQIGEAVVRERLRKERG